MNNPKAKPAAIGTRKVAWVIGNGNYTRWNKLRGATKDAEGMASHYKGRGYEVIHTPDQTGKDLSAGALFASAQLKRGDDFVLYYAGHGAKCGIVGVDAPADAMPVNHCLGYSTLANMAAEAVAKGYGAKIILDACHTGALQEEIAKNHAATHKEKAIETDPDALSKMQTKYRPEDFKKMTEHGEASRKGLYEAQFE